MKKEIQVFEYAKEILTAVKTGVLLTTKAGENVNTMAISWGMLGIEWNTPIFTVFVRTGRYTHELLDATLEFTINVPLGDFDKNIIKVCGLKSGRDCDKIKELGLTLIDSDCITVPAIKELPLTLECTVLYRQAQDEYAIPDYIKQTHYPKNIASSHPSANKDFHTAYYGKIVKAYIC